MPRRARHKTSSLVVLGLIAPGVSLTAALLILYGYAAWNQVSRRYLNRVSFRLLVYALMAQYVSFCAAIYVTDGSSVIFGIALATGTLTADPGWRCELLAFMTNLSLMFSAGMFFCIAVNLPLVLVYKVNGQRMEKYYVFGTAVMCLICNVPPYAWAVDDSCWYSGTDPAETLRWLIGTQTFWILSTSTGEVVAFLIIVGYLIVHGFRTRDFRADTRLSATYRSEASRQTGLTILMFRNIIFRIGLYPLVSCILSISTAVLDLHEIRHADEKALNWRIVVADLTIYAARPLIYVVLAAMDPSFTRALHALRHPESDSETGAHHTWGSAQRVVPSDCLSTVIIEMPPDEDEYEPDCFVKDVPREQSQTATGTSTSRTEEWNRGQVRIGTNAAPNRRTSVNDVVYHI
ncbi:hypothetical protein B0H13DRAFT_2328422 [Mycena leptocephala]|nr:hypothetical protein B0H13DRAFT_2328422 [Mycena leptocephala]